MRNSAFGSFETKNGLVVRVRPIIPDDVPHLVDLFEHMGSESRYLRFMQPLDNVDPDRVWSEARLIAKAIQDDRSFGLVAFIDLPERPETPVAGARYVKFSETQAEIAVSVRDDFQNLGIGSRLLDLLIQEAVERGITQLVGAIQNSNTAMWAMLRKIGYRVERHPEGNYCLVSIHVREPENRQKDLLDTAADFSPEPQIIW